MAKLFKNPITSEEKTACQWAMELQHSRSAAFRSYYKKWADRGDYKQAFASIEERKKTAYKNRRRPSRLFKNPLTGKQKPAKEWAKIQGCTISHFRHKFREYGPNDDRTWVTLEDNKRDTGAHFGNKGNDEWRAMKRGPRDLSFNAGLLEQKYL